MHAGIGCGQAMPIRALVSKDRRLRMSCQKLLDELPVSTLVVIFMSSIVGCGSIQRFFATPTLAPTNTSIPTQTNTPTSTPTTTPTPAPTVVKPTSTPTPVPTTFAGRIRPVDVNRDGVVDFQDLILLMGRRMNTLTPG